MQSQLFQLILMGQFSFLICEVHQYIFIDSKKTWCEARAYCKENYTDLASVPNVRFMKKLQNKLKDKDEDEAWIGLYNKSHQNGTWKWSQPGVESDVPWENNQPEDKPHENCGRLGHDGDKQGLKELECQQNHTFICYNERNNNVSLYNESKSWPDAQNYCRSHHSDLASGLTQFSKVQVNSLNHWIGLFKDSWRWSDNSSSSYRHWATFGGKTESGTHGTCAVSLLNNSGKWKATTCDERKPFICYKENVVLIKQKKEWDAALGYCRKNHSDLVSIITLEDQSWIQEKAKEADTDIWLGLQYSCPLDLWFWLNDMVSDDNLFQGEKQCDTVVAMSKEGKYTLIRKGDKHKYNFVCSV